MMSNSLSLDIVKVLNDNFFFVLMRLNQLNDDNEDIFIGRRLIMG